MALSANQKAILREPANHRATNYHFQKIGEHKILSITSTIVESAKRLQDKCVDNWIKDKTTNDYIPVIKESSRHMIECQRIELIRTTSVTKVSFQG